jgi:prepilin-type N-terminal cleavage/methylation domain-containing protein
MLKIKKFFKNGFTLVELIVVIAIVAILAAVSVGAYIGVTNNAKKSLAESESKEIQKIYKAYQVEMAAGTKTGDLFDLADGFVDYAYSQGVRENSLNYYLDHTIAESYAITPKVSTTGYTIKRAFNPELEKIVFFSVTKDGWATSFDVSIANGVLNNVIAESSFVDSSFQTVINKALKKFFPTKNAISLESLEYAIGSNLNSLKSPRAKVTLYDENVNAIGSFMSRIGKTIDKTKIDEIVPNIQYLVTKEKTATSNVNEDGFNVESNITAWKVVENKAITSTLYDLKTEITGDVNIAGVPDKNINYSGVSTINRNFGAIYKEIYYERTNTTLTEKVENSSSSFVKYVFDDIATSINFSSSYKSTNTYQHWTSKKKSSCGNITDGTPTRNANDVETIKETTIYDTIVAYGKNLAIDKNVELKENVTLLLSSNLLKTSAELAKGYITSDAHNKVSGSDVIYDQEFQTKPNLSQITKDLDVCVTSLNINSGKVFTNNGNIIVSSYVGLSDTAGLQSAVLGYFANINVETNAKFVNNNKLTVYGVITGDGELINNNTISSRASLVWASASTSYNLHNSGVFPTENYHFDALKIKSRFNYGSSLNIVFVIYGDSIGWKPTNELPIISSSDKGIFILKDTNAYIELSYTQALKDLNSFEEFDLYGNISSKAFVFSISASFYSFDLDLATSYFPINNMNINVYGNLDVIDINFKLLANSSINVLGIESVVNLRSSLLIEPGAVFKIEKGTLNISSNSNTLDKNYGIEGVNLGIGGYIQKSADGLINTVVGYVNFASFVKQNITFTFYTYGESYVKNTTADTNFKCISYLKTGTNDNNNASSVYVKFVDTTYLSLIHNAQGLLLDKNTTIGEMNALIGSTPTQTGKTFLGWSQYQNYSEHTESAVLLKDSDTITSNIGLYPVFGA